jgi:hypothetical protein
MKAFLKVIGIILIVSCVLLISAVIGGYIFLKNVDIKKYKPRIIQIAARAVGRPVDFEDVHLNVSLEEGIRLRLLGLSIAESPEFGAGRFVFIQEVNAGVDILAFLMSRQISVPSVLVRSPEIHVVRNAVGTFNVQTVGQPSQETSSPEKQSPSPAAALPVVFVNSFKIENARVVFVDQSVDPELELSVTQLTLDARRFSLTNPFDVLLEAAVLSAEKNFQLSGKAQLKLLNKEARLSDTQVTVDLNQLPLDQLKTSPFLKGVPLPQNLEGQVKIKLKEVVLSEKGLEKLNVDVSLADAKVFAPEIVPGISVEANNVRLGIDHFTLDGSIPAGITFKAALFQDQTNVDFTGQLSFNIKTLEASLTEGQLTTDLGLWPMDKIKTAVAPLKDIPLPGQLSGLFQVSIKEVSLSPAGLKTILLDADLAGGDIALNNLASGLSLALSKIDLKINNFSLAEPFSVSLKTAYLSEAPNLTFDGTVSYNLNSQVAEVKKGAASIDLDGFPLDRFKASGLVPDGAPFPEVVAGKINVEMTGLAVSPQGLLRMAADVRWQDGKIIINEAAPGISVAASSINIGVKRFSLNNEPFDIVGSFGYESEEPNISFDGKMALDLAARNIYVDSMDVKTDLGKISMGRLKSSIAPLKDVPLPEILKGQVDIHVKDLSAGPKGLMTASVDAALEDGEVSIKDVAPGVSLAASRISARVKDFGLDKPFGFDVQMAYLSQEPNIHAQGTAVVQLEDQNVTLQDAGVRVDLSSVSMDRLKSSVAALKDVSLPEYLKGDFNLTVTEAIAGSKGLAALAGEAFLKGWEVKLKELVVPMSGKDMRFNVTEDSFAGDPVQVTLGGGQITVRLSVLDYMTRRDFDLAAEMTGINVAEILDQKDAPVKVEGLLLGSIKAKGRADDVSSITGDANFEVKEAKLKDLNVLKTVLDKISFLPDVAARVEANLPEKYKEKLKDTDTAIKKISAVGMVLNGVMVFDPVSIEADEFVFLGKCQAGFDQKYSLDGAVKIPAELSAVMAESVGEFQYLYDEDNNISLPVHVAGQGARAPLISVTQTAVDMGKNVIRNQGKKEFEKILKGVLGAPEPPADSETQNQQQEAPAEEHKTPEAEIIDNILDAIFNP